MDHLSFDLEPLKLWFSQEKRDLPWRASPTPYHVWISEVMLQQTQVEVVKGYFKRWVELFPSIEALAQAPLDKVIKAWEGLGYYSRARNLHEGAKQLLLNHGGNLPDDKLALQRIKGLGPYTVGAILSFAFHRREAAVDGNVSRVLSRLFSIEEDVITAKRRIWEIAEKILPEAEPWVIVEALIELRALVCKRTPQCEKCPLKKGCLAHLSGKTHLIPLKTKPVAITHLNRLVAVIQCGEFLLLRKGAKGRVMADLYEFPYVESDLEGYLRELLGEEVALDCHLPDVEHSFTRYRVKLFPSLWSVKERIAVEGHEWISNQDLEKIPCSSGHRRIAQDFLLDFGARTM